MPKLIVVREKGQTNDILQVEKNTRRFAPWLGSQPHMLGENATEIEKGTPSKGGLEDPLGMGDEC